MMKLTKRSAVGIGAGLLVLIVGATVYGTLNDTEEVATESTTKAVRSERMDLVEFTTLDGELAFAETKTVKAQSNGVVTEIAEEGTTLSSGDVVVRFNDEPISLLVGDAALYRNLSVGDSGDDVLMLEQNLASMGFHVTNPDDEEQLDAGFSVDGEFDNATEDALIRFQEELGLAETGTFNFRNFVAASGDAQFSAANLQVGDTVQSQQVIGQLNVLSEDTGLFSTEAGQAEPVIELGKITSGDVIYAIDDKPVIAMVSDVRFERDMFLGVSDGDDIEALEQILTELGYLSEDSDTVDESFDEDTEDALNAWLSDLSEEWDTVEADGTLGAIFIVSVAPDMALLTDLFIDESITYGSGARIGTFTATEGNRVVDATINTDDQDLVAIGDSVTIELPDGQLRTGTIISISNSAAEDQAGNSLGIPLKVAVLEVPAAFSSLAAVDVDVKLETSRAANVVAVPVGALIAQSSDSFVVEVVSEDGATSSFVSVEPGIFADGFVEVDGIDDGTPVVVPS